MKANYPIRWVPATPEYVLAYMQEEWRQFAGDCRLSAGEMEKHMPTFNTTIQEWCDEQMLDEWMPLGKQLNLTWDTSFTRKQWREVFAPAGQKTIRGVCELLAAQAKRPVIPPAKILGHESKSAGVFLAIRALLIEAGAPANLRPSFSLEPCLKKWRKVFLRKIDRLVLGGLPYVPQNKFWTRLAAATCGVGVLLLGVSGFVKESPEVVIAGVLLFATGYLGSICHGPLALENVNTFRDLVELIVKKQRLCGFDPQRNSPCENSITNPL